MSNTTFITSREHTHHTEHLDKVESGLDQVKLHLSDMGDVCLDLETTGLVYNANSILLIVIGNRHHQFVIDYGSYRTESITELLLCLRGKRITGHNLGFDLPFLLLRHGSIFDTCVIYDTMIVEQVLVKGTSESVSLQNTVKRRLGVETFDKNIRMEFVGMNAKNPFFDHRHINYAAEDILFLEDLIESQSKFLSKYKQHELALLNNRIVLVTSQMKVDGMYVDQGKWMNLYYQNLRKSDELEVMMDEELAKVGLKQSRKRVKERTVQTSFLGDYTDIVNNNTQNINYKSSSQVIHIFRSLKLAIPKSAKEDKNSIGEATLQQYLINRQSSPLKHFIELLIAYKQVSKQANTFGKVWLKKYVGEDGRVHSSLKVNTTTTGRFSSSTPNLQQIPSDNRFRECFTGENGKMIFTCDYASAELRILASLSRDSTMLKLLSEDGDLHGYAATKVLRYLKDDDTLNVSKSENSEFRSSMKNVIFGLLYGAGVQKIAELLDISSYRAEKVYDVLSRTFPQAFEYLEAVSHFGVNNGYIVFDNVYNQRRWFPEFFKTNGRLDKKQRGIIERACKNSPIQGLNGQMMKLAMVYIYDFIRSNNLSSKIISTVHDEIVIEVGEGEEGYAKDFGKMMVDAGNYFLEGIEMTAEYKVKSCWSK